MKKAGLVFAVLFIVVVPIILLLTDVQLVAYDRSYYRSEYERYDVPGSIGMNMDNLMDSTEKLLLYLENKRDDLDFKGSFIKGEAEFFSPRDKQHMIDVKGLFINGFYIRNLTLVYAALFLLLLFWKTSAGDGFRKLARCGIAIAFAGIAPVLLVIILMSIDFYKYFTVFHKIFFTNDLWLLDPAVDRLVNIFPEQFFTDMAFRISYLYIAEMAVILIGSMLVLRYFKAVKEKS